MSRVKQVRRKMNLAAAINLWQRLLEDRSNLRSKIECDAT